MAQKPVRRGLAMGPLGEIMKRLLICVVSLLCLIGCEEKREKAKKAVDDGLKKLSQELDKTKDLARVDEVVKAVQDRNMPALKRLCESDDSAGYREVMTCYYEAFAIENDQGTDAARTHALGQADGQEGPLAGPGTVD